MTERVVRLLSPPGNDKPPDPEFIAWLEGLVADAKAGKLRALAYAAVTTGRISWMYMGSCRMADMLAAVSMLHHGIMTQTAIESEG